MSAPEPCNQFNECTLPVSGGHGEVSELSILGSGAAGAGARFLLLSAGEQANAALGDPLACARTLLARSGGAMRFAYPRWTQMPGWYADRDDLGRSPESDLLSVAQQWTQLDDAPLYLVGFSKSGYAALSILARHWRTGIFAGAVAWDAPLMLKSLVRNSMVASYGTQSAFARHCLLDLVRELSEAVRTSHVGLVLDGYVAWGVQMRAFHNLLVGARTDHSYGETRRNRHCWDIAWMEGCISMLAQRGPRGRAGIDACGEGAGGAATG